MSIKNTQTFVIFADQLKSEHKETLTIDNVISYLYNANTLDGVHYYVDICGEHTKNGNPIVIDIPPSLTSMIF